MIKPLIKIIQNRRRLKGTRPTDSLNVEPSLTTLDDSTNDYPPLIHDPDFTVSAQKSFSTWTLVSSELDMPMVQIPSASSSSKFKIESLLRDFCAYLADFSLDNTDIINSPISAYGTDFKRIKNVMSRYSEEDQIVFMYTACLRINDYIAIKTNQPPFFSHDQQSEPCKFTDLPQQETLFN